MTSALQDKKATGPCCKYFFCCCISPCSKFLAFKTPCPAYCQLFSRCKPAARSPSKWGIICLHQPTCCVGVEASLGSVGKCACCAPGMSSGSRAHCVQAASTEPFLVRCSLHLQARCCCIYFGASIEAVDMSCSLCGQHEAGHQDKVQPGRAPLQRLLCALLLRALCNLPRGSGDQGASLHLTPPWNWRRRCLTHICQCTPHLLVQSDSSCACHKLGPAARRIWPPSWLPSDASMPICANKHT